MKFGILTIHALHTTHTEHTGQCCELDTVLGYILQLMEEIFTLVTRFGEREHNTVFWEVAECSEVMLKSAKGDSDRLGTLLTLFLETIKQGLSWTSVWKQLWIKKGGESCGTLRCLPTRVHQIYKAPEGASSFETSSCVIVELDGETVGTKLEGRGAVEQVEHYSLGWCLDLRYAEKFFGCKWIPFFNEFWNFLFCLLVLLLSYIFPFIFEREMRWLYVTLVPAFPCLILLRLHTRLLASLIIFSFPVSIT